MFRNRIMQRTIAALLLTTFTSLSLYPLTAAAQVKDAIGKAGLLPKQKDEGVLGNAQRYFSKLAAGKGAAAAGREQGADVRFAQLLNDIHEELKAAVPHAALPKEAQRYAGDQRTDGSSPGANGRGGMDARAIGPDVRIEVERDKGPLRKPLPGTDIAGRIKHIKDKTAEIKRLYPAVEQSFKDTEAHLNSAKLPPEILSRHREAVAQYDSRKAEFERLTGKLAQTNNGDEQHAALAELGTFMAKHPNAKPHQYTDPDKLPFRTPDGKVRKPFETKEQFQASLFPPKYEKVMLASLSLDGVKLAQATLPEAPNAQDLAETEDAQITQAIRDQANALERNPVKIYNWVRNNIAFIPSYGSIQGADLTLQNRRGNAFDTASLLIALLRSSGIAARYVYGTIEAPADKVMNWVGGVTKPEAAQSLLGQGGIPNVGLVAGGAVRAFRMEHVWVEAHVDYVPSRGAKNLAPDTWVPLDASFKQYQFNQGMDIKSNVPLNAQALLDQIKQGATVNETEGWVQNLNQINLQSQLTAYQDQVKTYINSRKANATVGDVLGTQRIIEQHQTILLGSLPYRTVAIGSRAQALPDKLKWKFKTNIYAADGISNGDNPNIEINQSTAKLAGKKITLSFVPATQADRDLINSYLPKPHADGTPIQQGELPTSLPGYLLKMKAEFRIEGQVVAQTADGFTMGSDVRQSNQYFNPSTGAWEGGNDNDITVGEYNAIELDLQGTSYTRLATAKSALSTSQSPDVLSATGTPHILAAAISGYFAAVQANDLITAKTFDVVNYRAPSYGRFFVAASPNTWFGIARSVSFPGVVMDVDYLSIVAEANNFDKDVRAGYVQQANSEASAAEHSVPEKLFADSALSTDVNSFPQGVSAVKAIAIAQQNGQPIYLITSENITSILPVLKLGSDVKQDIANAVASGKEVVTHQENIRVAAWEGSGYVLIDQNTGAGAYKIAGGFNGGVVNFAVNVANQPSLLLPPCAESYLQTLIDNFLAANSAIPGIAFPTGAGLVTAKFVADATGGQTFLTAIKLSYKNPGFLLGNLRVALIIASLNFLIMSFMFELGLLTGSAVGAAFCRRN